MKIKQNPQDDVMVLEVSGKIMGGPDLDKFKDEIKELIERGYKNVVLDFVGRALDQLHRPGHPHLRLPLAEGRRGQHEDLQRQGTRAEHLLHLPAREHLRGLRTRDEALASFK